MLASKLGLSPQIRRLTPSLTSEHVTHITFLQYVEANNQPPFGIATFPTPTITITTGQPTKVSFYVSHPSGVIPFNLPIFGGFVSVADSDGYTHSIHMPSLNTPYTTHHISSLNP